MGENVLGAVLEFGQSLAEGEDKACTERKLVFFDFLGLVMASPLPMLLVTGLKETASDDMCTPSKLLLVRWYGRRIDG